MNFSIFLTKKKPPRKPAVLPSKKEKIFLVKDRPGLSIHIYGRSKTHLVSIALHYIIRRSSPPPPPPAPSPCIHNGTKFYTKHDRSVRYVQLDLPVMHSTTTDKYCPIPYICRRRRKKKG